MMIHNEKCKNCMWFDKCYDMTEECDDYTPIDDEDYSVDIENIRDESQQYYLEQIEEQDN